METPTGVIKLHIQSIRKDGGTQIRVAINQAVVEEYAAIMKGGTIFPPVIVFFDGWHYWLADGFHRVLATESIGAWQITAEVKAGTKRDAVLYSCTANTTHGLRLSAKDKRRAVKTLLTDPEWSNWSDREIARRCAVSAPMVSSLRDSICKNLTDTKLNIQRKVQRGGKTYVLNTANIGGKTGTIASEFKENDLVIVSASHPPLDDGVLPGGMNGKIIFIPNPKNALVELAQGRCALLLTRYLDLNPFPQYIDETELDLPQSSATSANGTCGKRRSFVNIDDLISSLNDLSNADLQKLGRAISQLQAPKAEVMVRSLVQSKELSVALKRAIASVYPDTVEGALDNLD